MFHALPISHVGCGNGKTGPHIDLVFAYIGTEMGAAPQQHIVGWLPRNGHRNAAQLILNSFKRPDLSAHGNSYSTDSIFFDETSIFPKDVVFDDGA